MAGFFIICNIRLNTLFTVVDTLLCQHDFIATFLPNLSL
ncbi:hypothetical protein MDMS009_1019 [Methylophaga thiooxydans DMS010]|uniref:Uncharacterized protein n=1 Tax=Methylophaga thiooxydans DMS010 TaxID=637616 RepID=C0N4C7_9GAMM|nr:hypothetical protein MDMS009_1019 [Methylophaga thiooxydans DMS010]